MMTVTFTLLFARKKKNKSNIKDNRALSKPNQIDLLIFLKS